MKILSTKIFSNWIDHLQTRYSIIGPKRVGEKYVFDEIHSAKELNLEYPTSILPPKKVLIPQREDLIKFNMDNGEVEPLLEDRSIVIMGIHTCDLHAVRMLDRVFKQGFVDQHYLAHRENITLVSIECTQPCSNYCFCKDMDTLKLPEEFDLHLIDLGEDYAVTIGSEKGNSLLAGCEYISEATANDNQRINVTMSEKWSNFLYRLDVDINTIPGLFTNNLSNPLWDEIGKKCLGCGNCTIVCPTCYCFNIIDEVDFSLHSGTRFRVWDSCQLNEFAVVAGGHDFRPSRSQRQRHRFLRKFKYQSSEDGLMGCVGCGRCAQACLVGITPINVVNSLYMQKSFSNKKPMKGIPV